MTAAETIETLLRLGALLKDAAQRGASSSAEGIDWGGLLGSPEFARIEAAVAVLLERLGKPDLTEAVRIIEERQQMLLGGRKVSDLAIDDLIAYSELGDVRLALASRRVEVAASAGFFAWLVQDALPVLLATARTVIPLLV